MEAGRTDDVITVLEFAVGTGTDISESYTMLANCYKQKALDTKLDILKNQVEQSSLYFKDSILEKIS
jgi:hypothetical protein